MPEIPTAADVARAVADALDRREIPYAIGGALALGFYAPPRATIDVDVNAFISIADRLDEVIAALADAGFALETPTETFRTKAAETGQFRGYIHGVRVDVFVPAIPFYGELQASRRRVELLGRPIWILGPEDLAILKLMFFRRKDLADVEALFRDQGPDLDRAYVRRRLVEFVGNDDERLAALASIEHDIETEQ